MSENSNQAQLAWEASEYVHHEKGAAWFIYYGIASAAIIGATYLVLKDIVSIVVVTLMVVTLAVFANRKPNSLHYELDDEGLKIEKKEYPYRVFKSFSIMNFGAIESIYLEPLERFMPPISLYFAPEDADKVIDILGQYLPHRERQPDFVEKFVHRIRL